MNEPHFSPDALRMVRARKLSVLLFAAVMLLSLPLVGGFFGSWHPAFDSLAHFRVHLAAVLMSAALPLVLSSFRIQALAALALGAGAIATVAGRMRQPVRARRVRRFMPTARSVRSTACCR